MRILVKGIIFASIASNIILKPTIQYKEVVLLLLIISITLVVGEFGRKWQIFFMCFETTLVFYGYFTLDFGLEMMSIVVFDAIYLKMYFVFIFIGGILLWIRELLPLAHHFMSLSLSGIMAFMLRDSKDRNVQYREILDAERRMRYDLEIVKNALILSNQEIERLTEVKERNRIARDLHDNIGHSLAGIVIQLQAALKISDRDQEKSKSILNQCVERLQSSLETVRCTVHNMYSKDKIGIEYLQEIISNYKYCKVEAIYSGDFTEVTNNCIEALTTILKEALTNITKHSGASRVEVSVSTNSKIVRMQIHDNGKGFEVIHEGLGIRSMQDRIHHLNGIFSIDGKQGTRIVCTIPIFGGEV